MASVLALLIFTQCISCRLLPDAVQVDLRVHPPQPSMVLGKGAGCFSAAVGVVVLIGWMLDSAVLKSLHPSLVAMKANVALGFFLAGWALYQN